MSGEGGFVTALRSAGCAVLPAPRQVELTGATVRLDGAWRAAVEVGDDDIAAATLTARLADEFGLVLAGADKGRGVLRLAVKAGTVATGAGAGIDRQAYRITIAGDRIEIVGNAAEGLFYGVQTFLQLLDGPADAGSAAAGDGRERLALPAGTITDWPAYELRVVHWDTKHHQDRIETLKRTIDWMARFKFNAVSFELEDKFAYPSHPVIGAPGAYTAEQMQDLTAYGLERYVQIIPNVQAPAHMCYVLKHEEFAHLRCDGSNYQICMDDPEARRLIFDMYDDVCAATPGVKYFHVSTDEVYYAGICEKFRKPYNAANRSRTWVDFVRAAHEHLTARGREVMIWLEFPLLPEHVKMLPADIIDAIATPRKNPGYVAAMDAAGIRRLAYCPIQGEEYLFPDYFPGVDRHGRRQAGRLDDAMRATRREADAANFLGSFVAGWDDAGLHNETFWLGWAAMAQGGWNAWADGAPTVEQTTADFMDVYYGGPSAEMAAAYRTLQSQARFFETAWDRRTSKVRGPAYGYSYGKRPVTRNDPTLLPPDLPQALDLAIAPGFAARYSAILAEVPARQADNDRLIDRLLDAAVRARRNRHNIEVLLSLAYLVRHFLGMLPAVAQAEADLVAAAGAHAAGDPGGAIGLMRQAGRRVGEVIDDLGRTYRRLVAVWEVGRLPKNAPVGGREFLHVMDDVKDHFADRRADLSYMIAPEESIGLGAWRDGLDAVIEAYERAHAPADAGTGVPDPDDA